MISKGTRCTTALLTCYTHISTFATSGAVIGKIGSLEVSMVATYALEFSKFVGRSVYKNPNGHVPRHQRLCSACDPAKADVEVIAAFLRESYWAKNIPIAVVRKSIENSLTFNLLKGE